MPSGLESDQPRAEPPAAWLPKNPSKMVSEEHSERRWATDPGARPSRLQRTAVMIFVVLAFDSDLTITRPFSFPQSRDDHLLQLLARTSAWSNLPDAKSPPQWTSKMALRVGTVSAMFPRATAWAMPGTLSPDRSGTCSLWAWCSFSSGASHLHTNALKAAQVPNHSAIHAGNSENEMNRANLKNNPKQ